MPFNTDGMFRGYINENGKMTVLIYDNEKYYAAFIICFIYQCRHLMSPSIYLLLLLYSCFKIFISDFRLVLNILQVFRYFDTDNIFILVFVRVGLWRDRNIENFCYQP